MRKLILILFIFVFLLNSLIALDYHYEINLSQNETGLFLEEINVELGEIEEEQISYGDSLLQVFSFDHEIFYEINFETFGYAIMEGDLGRGYFESELVYYNFTEINLLVPYYPNANEIIIYDENLNEKLRIDVSMYSKVSAEELKGEILTEEEKIAKEEQERKEQERETKTFTDKLAKNWGIFGIILLILVIILIRSFSKKKAIK